MTYKEKVVEIIKQSKKYSKLNLLYEDDDCIEYVTNDNSFKIEIDDLKYSFTYMNYSNMLHFKVKNEKSDLEAKKIISKFGLMIKYLNKLDCALIKINEKTTKLITTIEKIIKSEYDSNILLTKNNFRIQFPMDRIRVRNKMKNVYFDLLKKDIENVTYEIFVNFKKDNLDCDLKFNYLLSDNKIVMIENISNYRNNSKNITNIIRCERLKQLSFLND